MEAHVFHLWVTSPSGQLVSQFQERDFFSWAAEVYHGPVDIGQESADGFSSTGTAAQAPYQATWDTSWVPDQKQPMALAARLVDDNGIIYMTEAVTDLSLDRQGTSVELCKPYDIPKKWVTRSGEKAEHFIVTGDLSKAVAAQLVWSSWSPGYMRGVSINGMEVNWPGIMVLIQYAERK